jgi:hypothetical protein
MEQISKIKVDLIARFSTEEAIGVYFGLEFAEGPERFVTASQLAVMESVLKEADFPGAHSLLPHGGSGVCCTDYASHIFLELPGRVRIVGFVNEDNPTSRCAREEFHPCGHDFAIVDDRYLVDPWPKLVLNNMEQVVFDMSDPADAALVRDVYGPRDCWGHMTDAENYALERQAESR